MIREMIQEQKLFLCAFTDCIYGTSYKFLMVLSRSTERVHKKLGLQGCFWALCRGLLCQYLSSSPFLA